MESVKKYWQKYESLRAYNSTFKPNKDYYNSIKVWNDFYNGDQWPGLEGDQSLPQLVFNIIKRVVEFKIASLTSSDIAVNIEPLEYTPKPQGVTELDTSDFLNAEIKNIFEKINMKIKTKDVLLDGAITGDMCFHIIFNPKKKPYRSFENVLGEIEIETIDATNIGFGNANIKDVEKQPWIIVVGRDTVKNLKAEAKSNKDSIKSDTDTQYQTTEFADTEINIEGDDEGKALYIYLYEKKDGKVVVTKCTQTAIIFENVDTGLSRYPIAFSNWYKQKNTFHGRGEVEGLCPNQIAINKMFAMIVYHQMMTAFPTAVYDGDVLEDWTNEIGTAFRLEGLNGRSIKDVAGYLEPSNMSDYIIKVIDLAFQYTKECLGVSDAALGQIDPKNTSAIIAVQKSTAVPLSNIRDNLYDLVEQLTMILIDMMAVKYGQRPVLIMNEDGSRKLELFDFSQLQGMDLKTSIDVGETSYYSEIASLQTLDNLLNADRIEFIDYLERVPAELIPKKAELITKLKEAVEVQQQNAQYEQMAQFLETLPPEVQQQVMSLPAGQQEQAIMQLMNQSV